MSSRDLRGVTFVSHEGHVTEDGEAALEGPTSGTYELTTGEVFDINGKRLNGPPYRLGSMELREHVADMVQQATFRANLTPFQRALYDGDPAYGDLSAAMALLADLEEAHPDGVLD